MVNHIRTLLLNRGRDGHSLATPGEEYVPRTYVPRKQTGIIALASRVLFGQGHDRVFANLRMRQLLTLLHASPLEDYITQTDPRVTYLPWKALDAVAVPYAVTVSRISGNGGAAPIVTGTYTANDALGVSRVIWRVDYAISTLTITRQTPPTSTTGAVTIANVPSPPQAYTEAFALTGSDLKLRIFDNDATTNASWLITAIAPPSQDIALPLYQLSEQIGNYWADVFPPAATGRTAELAQIYRATSDACTKYAAMLLALADYTDRQLQEVA